MMKRYLKGPDVDERYDISHRTRKSWVEKGLLPKPMIRNGVEFYAEDELLEHERRDTAAPTARWKDRHGKLRRGNPKSTEPTPPDAA